MTKKKLESNTSVKSYQREMNSEKEKLGAYTKKMGASVRSLHGEFKRCSKEMQTAGKNMIEEGNRNMSANVKTFNEKIKNQIQENKEAAGHIGNSIKFYLSEINKKKKNFAGYIKSFWG